MVHTLLKDDPNVSFCNVDQGGLHVLIPRTVYAMSRPVETATSSSTELLSAYDTTSSGVST